MAEWKSITHTLAYPVTVGEGTKATQITEVVMHEPDAEAVEKIQEAGGLEADEKKGLTVKQIIVCVAALSKLPESTVRKFHYRDITALGGQIGPLFAGSETESGTETSTS